MNAGTLFHVGISGGKDSVGLLLWAIHESGIPISQLRVTSSDTGNEDELTYAHLRYLHEHVIGPAGIPGGLEILFPERDFFALAFHEKRFPSRVAQFCTIELKIKPMKEWLKARWAEGYEVCVLNGKRVSESHQRKKTMANQPERGFSDYWGTEEWMPLRNWTLSDVFAIHERHGVPLNPLYALGAKRVGCFPCVNCGKGEIRMVAKHRPEKVAKIAAAEKRFETELGRVSTFFHSRTATAPFRTKEYTDSDGKKFATSPIEEIIKWSHTERGGKQIRLDFDEPASCFLNYHGCE